MAEPEYSVENMKKLAQAVTDAMSVEDLQRVNYEQTYAGYEESHTLFLEDWQNFMAPIPSQTISDEAVRDYVLHGGEKCPHCQGGDIQIMRPAVPNWNTGLRLLQTVKCQNPRCGHAWREVYLLTDIER